MIFENPISNPSILKTKKNAFPIFFKINIFFQEKKNHFYKNPNRKEREPFLKFFTKK